MFKIDTIVCLRCQTTAATRHDHDMADEARRKENLYVNTAGRLYSAAFRGMTPTTEGR